MPSTITWGLPYSATSDPPNGPAQLQALAEAVDADLTTINNKVVSLETNASASDTQNASGTTASLTFTSTLSGGTACGVAFVAPSTGVVVIHNQTRIGATLGYVYCSVRVRTGSVVGSGSDFVGDSINQAIMGAFATGPRMGVSLRVAGLTPGASYNVQQRFAVDSGTGTFDLKHLIVTRGA